MGFLIDEVRVVQVVDGHDQRHAVGGEHITYLRQSLRRRGVEAEMHMEHIDFVNTAGQVAGLQPPGRPPLSGHGRIRWQGIGEEIDVIRIRHRRHIGVGSRHRGNTNQEQDLPTRESEMIRRGLDDLVTRDIPRLSDNYARGVDHDPGRIWHYRDFYRPAGTPAPEDKPLWLIWGNCQAEALRRVLDAVPDRPFRTARLPPVHELTSADLPYLERLLANTAVVLSQPIRPGYRDLPIGTTDLAARLPSSARMIRWPVIRYAGLHPFQAIVRHPADRSINPPAVPYHDLRTIAAARAGTATWDVAVTGNQLRAVAAASIDELARRERRDCDIGISDVLPAHGAAAAHTINHPGNPVLYDLAGRILDHLDVRLEVAPISETLLGSVYAPLDQRVLEALGVESPARRDWVLNGAVLDADEVHRVQMRWYETNPDYIGLAVDRHGATMQLLGLLPIAVTR